MTISRRALGAAILLPLAAHAEEWPGRPVTLVVPWAAGGSTDAVARILAARLNADTGRTVVVDNRTGANGTIGFGSVARARPDGTTVLVGTVSTYAMAPHLYQLPYDPDRAFTGVGLIAAQPIVMVVPKASPARTLTDFVALARRPNHGLTYANSGSGSSTHLATELFLHAAGLTIPDVGYRGGAPAVQATLTGEVSMVFQAASGLIPLIASGDLRPLAVTSAQRSLIVPDVPTFAESGWPTVEVMEHIALLVPAGTPAETVAAIHRAARTAIAAPETRERLAALAVTPEAQTPAEWPAYLAAENAKWREVIRARGIRVG